MSAVYIDLTDKRELDIIFSKMWSENISNIFVKDSAVTLSVGLHPTLQSSVTPVRMQTVFFCTDTSPWVGTLFQQQRRIIRLLWMLLQGVCQFNTRLYPLCVLRHFQSIGKIGNLFYHHGECLLGSKEYPAVFILPRHLQTADVRNLKRKMCYVGKHQLTKKIGKNK